MNSTRYFATAAVLTAALASHAATIEIGGELRQEANLKSTAITGVAVGPGAKAHAAVNEISGSVKVGGNARQTANLTSTAITAVAVGPGAQANARVNAVVSK